MFSVNLRVFWEFFTLTISKFEINYPKKRHWLQNFLMISEYITNSPLIKGIFSWFKRAYCLIHARDFQICNLYFIDPKTYVQNIAKTLLMRDDFCWLKDARQISHERNLDFWIQRSKYPSRPFLILVAKINRDLAGEKNLLAIKNLPTELRTK